MSKQPNVILSLHLIRGKEAFDSNGKLISENHPMKISYNTMEWENFKKNISKMGYSKVTLTKVFDANGTLDEDAIEEMTPRIEDEIAAIFAKPIKELTAEEKIERLEAKLAKMETEKGSPPSKNQEVEDSTNEEIDENQEGESSKPDDTKEDETSEEAESDEDKKERLREEYEKVTGEKPDFRWGINKLVEKIADANE